MNRPLGPLVAVVANALTILRLVLGLAFPWIPVPTRLAAVLFGGISDFVDGAWSRWWGATSEFGKVLDPIADKVFVLSVIGTLWYEGRLAAWQVVLLALRDVSVAVGGLWFTIHQRKRFSELRPRWAGKAATLAQFGLLVSLLVLPEMNLPLFWLTVALTAVAAADYGVYLIGRVARAGRH